MRSRLLVTVATVPIVAQLALTQIGAVALGAAGDLPIPAQLGILVPFLAGYFVIIRWLLKKIDELQKANETMATRVIGEVVPAMAKMTEVAQDLMEAARETRRERDREHDARVRAEERERR